MKTIKVKYCKYGNNTDHTTPLTFNYFTHNILKKNYDIEISDDPDYLFCHESSYEYLQYDCIRIFNTGENITANFNIYDYATGIDYIQFEDRYCRLPPYLVATFYSKKDIELSKDIDLENPKIVTKEDLAKKTDFCSFVYSNYLADKKRQDLLDTLNTYKKVNSGGKYLNNIGGPVENKLVFETKHKFSMAIENSCRNGYTTDRIVNGFMANTIPIYWGNPAIGKEFNTKRFINCHEYKNFDEVLERVKKIDSDDELYLQIINEPVFAEGYSFKKAIDAYEVFLKNIFDQPLTEARRRTINIAHGAAIENHERMIATSIQKKEVIRKFLSSVYKPFKKIQFIEGIKHSYFRKKLKNKA